MAESPPLRYVARRLLANLAAGARLVFGAPVSLVSFRVSVPQFLALTLLLWVVAGLDDLINVGLDGRFNIFGLLQQVFFSLLFVLASLALARLYRHPHLALALPVLLAAGELPIDATHLLLSVADTGEFLSDEVKTASWWVLLIWFTVMAARGMAVALGPSAWRRTQRALVAGCVFTGLTLVGLSLVPYQRLWLQPRDAVEPIEDNLPNVVSEQVLVEQPNLLDGALNALKDQRPGITDLYFVGFAPYAAQDVFRKDVSVARDIMDSRFDTQGRSLLLINNRRTLLDTPMATVSNLRATLEEVGKAIDPEEDVLVLYVASHGSASHQIAVEFGPLELEQLTPTALHRMLVESGIKWRIVIISACYSGGFIEPLKDAHTMVVTAAQSDRMSFGCSNESDSTYFGDAFFNQALRNTTSFLGAFEEAKAGIAEREKREGMSPPSNPQIFIGDAMAEKMKRFEAELIARRNKAQ